MKEVMIQRTFDGHMSIEVWTACLKFLTLKLYMFEII